MAVPPAAATPPAGFRDNVVASVSVPTALGYEPGTESLFVLSKGGGSDIGTANVRRKDGTTGAMSTARTIDCVDSRGERGLHEFAHELRTCCEHQQEFAFGAQAGARRIEHERAHRLAERGAAGFARDDDIEAMAFEESMAFAESQIGLFALTEDAAEGQLAFREKRKPQWSGR